VFKIYVDADACPVKQEVSKVAQRYQLNVVFVSNSWMRIPEGKTELIVVEGDRLDVADDWIAEHVAKDDIVVTADIPLANRCIKAGAEVLDHGGNRFSKVNIGQMMATRGLMSELREAGAVTGGPRPFKAQDRSRFLQSLDQVIQNIKRAKE
jgi:uncharacterized protein YaiI (UPF0178 family)